jgi:hypothetical protein
MSDRPNLESVKNKFAQAGILLTCSREVIGSCLGRDIYYLDSSFTWFLWFPPDKCQDSSLKEPGILSCTPLPTHHSLINLLSCTL